MLEMLVWFEVLSKSIEIFYRVLVVVPMVRRLPTMLV
jgi:hypothetical protein